MASWENEKKCKMTDSDARGCVDNSSDRLTNAKRVLYDVSACSSAARGAVPGFPLSFGSHWVFPHTGSLSFAGSLCVVFSWPVIGLPFCVVFWHKMDNTQVLKPYGRTTSGFADLITSHHERLETHFEYRSRPTGPRRLIGSFNRCPHLRRLTVCLALRLQGMQWSLRPLIGLEPVQLSCWTRSRSRVKLLEKPVCYATSY